MIKAGPVVAPPSPSLTVLPSALSGSPGSVLGPFTVTSSVSAATVTATGAVMYSDASATAPIANGSTVPSGTKIWLKSENVSAAVLQAVAEATVPTGNVYLYDGNSGPSSAQKLILAQTGTLKTEVDATAQFELPGSLAVTKTITGPAAGQQGAVTIQVVCNGQTLSPLFQIPASATGDHTMTYHDIHANSSCTVTETQDGSSSTVTVETEGHGQVVEVHSGMTATAHLTDSYSLVPGALVVSKTITGPGASQQGQVTIQPSCSGYQPFPPIVIPAGTTAGTVTQRYSNIKAGTSCTVTETANGANSSVTVQTIGGNQTVTIAPGATAEASVIDHYDLAPGTLVVNKAVSGPGAGQQGQITVTATCDGTPLTPALVITAGAPAGTVGSETYPNLPAGTVCTVLEGPDGSNAAVAVAEGGSGAEYTIPAGGTVTASLTDNYSAGELVVNKVITGPAAGLQGAVTIGVVCNGVAQPDFDIPTGAPAGTVSKVYSGILAGATCVVTETGGGGTATVNVSSTGTPQTVTIGASASGTADLVDTYAEIPGSLVVAKTVAGAAAGQQGAVTIQALCNGQLLAPFTIAAGAPAGTLSMSYPNLAAGTKCTVAETVDGSSPSVVADVTGRVQTVTVTAASSITAAITDTYSPAPGSLVVSKTIAGPGAGQQGAVTIAVSCGGTSLPDFVIPAGAAAGTLSNTYNAIPAGSVCSISESQGGTSSELDLATTGGPGTVTVAAGQVVPVSLTDTYTFAPGTLTVEKSIHGAAATQHGPIALLVDCGAPPYVTAVLIPAGATGTVSRSFTGLPAGSRCTVTEVRDGATASVDAAGPKPMSTTIGAGADASIRLVDTLPLDLDLGGGCRRGGRKLPAGFHGQHASLHWFGGRRR